MSAIITDSGHVLSAQSFMSKDKYYFKLGKDAAWISDPQTPTQSSDVNTLVGAKRVSRKAYVVEHEEGTIQYLGKKYKEVDPANIFTENAHCVYLHAQIADGDFVPGTEYNQLVLSTNLVTATGKEDAYTLLPADIKNQGNTIMCDYRRSVIIDENSLIDLTLILEF